ncbi:hypothetical protein HPB50_006871 [Hyalomma asiaticum]|uniref:Uncharacterized protein n=1 Tax=Hyalomma asiaticum TaxID=266040 RepID=A0ACB7T3F9_HYAAI|nr:hypothetical protein HPB50_006871 [Hyalomma asiaticum]
MLTTLKRKSEFMIARVGSLAITQGGHLRSEQKTTLYRNVTLLGIMYDSPVWSDELRPDCHPRSRMVSLQRAVLLNLLGASNTTRTTALHVLMNAPPITVELERVNAKFDLINGSRFPTGEFRFALPKSFLPWIRVARPSGVTSGL